VRLLRLRYTEYLEGMAIDKYLGQLMVLIPEVVKEPFFGVTGCPLGPSGLPNNDIPGRSTCIFPLHQ
jgi:hypothetical protein